MISSLPWQRARNQVDVGAGDLRGFPVVASGFPGRGFLKPGIAIVDSPGKSYAAREKIAADLAHDLSLPVPPAVLWRRKEHWEEVESRVVVSLYLYLESIDWALVEYAGKRPLNLDEGGARARGGRFPGRAERLPPRALLETPIVPAWPGVRIASLFD